MTFALMVLPLTGFMGLALDYAAMSRDTSELHNAADAAALFAARRYEVDGALPDQGEVKQFLLANTKLAAVEVTRYEKTTDPQTGAEAVEIEAQSNYDPLLMHLVNAGTQTLKVFSASQIGSGIALEVVMALDTTYSMIADGKIDGLKKAATNFTNVMFDAADGRTSVKVGLVPFDQYVNMPAKYRKEPWMDVPDDTAKQYSLPGCRSVSVVIGYDTCYPKAYVTDGVTVIKDYCPPIWGQTQVCTPYNYTVYRTWYGCVGTRGTLQNMLTLSDDMPSDPSGLEKARFPGVMQVLCARPLQPLTTDRAAILNGIDVLMPRNNTYIADGVMWAQRVLSPQPPFTEGEDIATSKKPVRKVIVLMTDGENFQSPRLDISPDHLGTDVARANDWTEKACAFAKTQGTEIYTVTFGSAVTPTARQIMRKCASTAQHFFDANNSGALDKAFQDIATNIRALRLTH
ncbi:pilus assembly protein TadG-related protein [Zhengella mangrovi]|uniref:pilus assembly protein TadG-related protein n=1 Tax=Zhengella mangrovi TaxID=1982044 RepID=UPI0013FD3183|nr:pilus assembly protein TadG-related protein [Zhengella mangrovi]